MHYCLVTSSHFLHNAIFIGCKKVPPENFFAQYLVHFKVQICHIFYLLCPINSPSGNAILFTEKNNWGLQSCRISSSSWMDFGLVRSPHPSTAPLTSPLTVPLTALLTVYPSAVRHNEESAQSDYNLAIFYRLKFISKGIIVVDYKFHPDVTSSLPSVRRLGWSLTSSRCWII